MSLTVDSFVAEKAKAVLRNASSGLGIKASLEKKDNYDRIWARDSAVSGLAILSSQLKDLYPSLQSSLSLLHCAAAENGQIPSNISLDDNGKTAVVSFGGPAGRTDASFWWIIAAVAFLKQSQDEDFKEKVKQQCHTVFTLANTWEFNGRGLMYLPMSSNWADEYVTHGYVLYDQILRHWALAVAGDLFEEPTWQQKAVAVKASIKQHYLLETPLENSLYTQAQQQALQNFDGNASFIASFSPGDRVEKYDAWSIALLMLLDIPLPQTNAKLNQALLRVFEEGKQSGIPAFWPVIAQTDPLYQVLKLNHNYNFKNVPGHFHNGGIWPVVNGFLIAGLTIAGLHEMAGLLMDALQQHLASFNAQNPFTEYWDFYERKPGGVKNLCFSASGYLIAKNAIGNPYQFGENLLPRFKTEERVLNTIRPAAESILNELNFNAKEVTVVAIAGESGSGKTTLSKAFKAILTEKGQQVLLLHQDDYFKLPPKKNHAARVRDFAHIGPQEVRIDLLEEHIKNIKKKAIKEVSIPIMNWETDTEETLKTDVSDVNVILVDGTYVLLLTEVDYKIYINTHHSYTRNNRVSRNREEVTDFIEKVLEKESAIISGQACKADVILNDQLQILHNKLTVSGN